MMQQLVIDAAGSTYGLGVEMIVRSAFGRNDTSEQQGNQPAQAQALAVVIPTPDGPGARTKYRNGLKI